MNVKRFKRAYVMVYVTLATILTGRTAAFATSVTPAPTVGDNTFNDPTGLSSSLIPTGDTSASLGSSLSSTVTWILGIVGGLAVAYTLYEIYHAAILFMGGGSNAQKREMAKTHIVHVAIGAAIIGASGLVLAVFLHLVPNSTTATPAA